jgi:hypothetical protein
MHKLEFAARRLRAAPLALLLLVGSQLAPSFAAAAPLSVQFFSPASGKIGTEVAITGTGFTGASSVTFNDSSAVFTVESDSLLRAIVPPGATTGPIAVADSVDTAISSIEFIVTLPPKQNSFIPTSGPVGTEVLVRGRGFTSALVVAFNGTASSFTVDSDTSLRAIVPAGATSGLITITNTIGTGTRPVPFNVTPVMGYRSFYYGDSVNSTPTGEKPESKLWWNDETWWGSLWNPDSLRYEIHRFDASMNQWTRTGVRIDERHSSKSDVLWDGEHLYVASHVFTTNAVPTVPHTAGRVYRYSYDAGADQYALDPGFPVTVNSSKSETLVLDKDSEGRLWVTWVEAGKVKVNHSLSDDLTWGTPFDLPVQGEDVALDDICSIVSFGDKTGIMWSNQHALATYFAVHLDSDPPGTWQTRETVLSDSTAGPLSDDHISLKALGDVVYAATKTNVVDPESPFVHVSRRDPSGTWVNHQVGRKIDQHTRPIVLLDPDNGLIHILAGSSATGKDVVYRKTASLSDLVFSEGLGVAFMDSPIDYKVGNITSTKQNLTSASGLLAIASDRDSRHYLHNLHISTPVGINPGPGSSRPTARLAPAAPNPFFQATRMRFVLPAAGRTRLEVFDVNGRLVRKLVDRNLPAGSHDVAWDGRDQESTSVGVGVYFIRLQGPGGVSRQSLVRLR